MTKRTFHTSILALAAMLALPTGTAHAANVLFVADAANDMEIAAALTADGHTVTIVTNDMTPDGRNPALEAALDEYDVIFWSGSGGAGWMRTGTAIENLTMFVMNGGRVFYTGYDSTVGETTLVSFFGFASSHDAVGSPPGAITSEATSLSVGVVDIGGMVPSDGYTDKDCLVGPTSDVTIVVSASGDPSCAQWSVRALGDGEVAWVSNGRYSGAEPSWSTTTSPFNAAIRNFAFAADAAAHEPGAPLIELDGPSSADEGEEVTITATVTDAEGDTVMFSWDLDDDGTFGEHAGETSVTIPAGTTDGPTTLRFAVEATDGTHTATRPRRVSIRNVAPEVVSTPPTITYVGAMLRYEIAVVEPGGAGDPLTFDLSAGPEGITISDSGLLTWNVGVGDVTTLDHPDHVAILISDGDMGTTLHEFDIVVSPNRVPTAPTLAYPVGGIGILDTTPRLAVGDAADGDPEDVLGYYFEIDTVDTFDSPDFRESGRIAEGAGFTAWPLETPLEMGRTYHWRAWASDGDAESMRVGTSFVVVPDPALIPDAGPLPDGGMVDAATAAPVHRGGCSVVRGTGGAGGAWMIAAVLGLALSRRRGRARPATGE